MKKITLLAVFFGVSIHLHAQNYKSAVEAYWPKKITLKEDLKIEDSATGENAVLNAATEVDILSVDLPTITIQNQNMKSSISVDRTDFVERAIAKDVRMGALDREKQDTFRLSISRGATSVAEKNASVMTESVAKHSTISLTESVALGRNSAYKEGDRGKYILVQVKLAALGYNGLEIDEIQKTKTIEEIYHKTKAQQAAVDETAAKYRHEEKMRKIEMEREQICQRLERLRSNYTN